MYSRNFGGIESEGQLYNMEREAAYAPSIAQSEPELCAKPEPESCSNPQSEEAFCHTKPKERGGILDIFRGGFLSNIKTDDLLLLGIAALLLFDGDTDNDILILVLAVIFFL